VVRRPQGCWAGRLACDRRRLVITAISAVRNDPR
jgi:hypothetical protein